MLNLVRKKGKKGYNREGGKDDTFDDDLHVQRPESRSIKKNEKRLSISIQQQEARQVRSITNVFASYVAIRPLALGRQTITANSQGPQKQHNTLFSKESSRGTKTPNANDAIGDDSLVFSVDAVDFNYEFRVEQLNNRRNNYVCPTYLCRKCVVHPPSMP